MSVEIVILSGSRQGERLRIEDAAFQAGDESTDAVAFDPAKDTGCRGRRVVFRLESDGWRVHNGGSIPVIVNQEELRKSRTIRSGDIVRLSAEGPDFSFHWVGPDSVPSDSGEPPVIGSTNSSSDVAESPRRMVVMLVPVILVGVILVVLAIKWANRSWSPEEQVLQTKTSAELVDEAEDEPLPVAKETKAGVTQAIDALPDRTPLPVDADMSSTEVPPTVSVPSGAGSIYLLAAEHPTSKTIYPYGSACAIRDDTLLTSATLAVELEKRRTAGWRVLAALPEEFPQLATTAREVTAVQVHRAFQALQETPVEQIFFDLAVLTVNRTMETSLELAGAADLARLETGQPLVCSGIPHAGERLTRFESPSAKAETVKIFFVMPFPANDGRWQSGAPSLLHLEGPLPAHMFGSPVFSAENHKVIGVYAERAELPPDMGEIELHYAAMVTLATAWLSGEGQQQWVAPSPPVKAVGEQE
ncbi:MAG: hypothetical protein ACC645_10735 [Pirellulales bacterium]